MGISAKRYPGAYNAFSRNNANDDAASCGAAALQKMCLCIQEWVVKSRPQMIGGGKKKKKEKKRKAQQLSRFQVGLAVLWQGDNAAGSESLTLRMRRSLC